jgi:hypothetical protein
LTPVVCSFYGAGAALAGSLLAVENRANRRGVLVSGWPRGREAERKRRRIRMGEESPETDQVRLDKQAAAIKRLRRDRDAMKAQVESLLVRVESLASRVETLEVMVGGAIVAEGSRAGSATQDGSARSSTGSESTGVSRNGRAEPVQPRQPAGAEWLPVVALVQQGTWEERGLCLVCGKDKGHGRDRHMMACAGCRAERSDAIKGKRDRPGIPRCLSCGAEKAPGGLMYLCGPCRPAARAAGC